MEIDILNLLPGYSHLFIDRKVSSLIGCQFTFCLVSTIFISYYLYRKIARRKEKSCHRAFATMRLLKERIGELDAQKEMLATCLDSTEDLCDVYYAFLRCIAEKKMMKGSRNENKIDCDESNVEEDSMKTGSGAEERELKREDRKDVCRKMCIHGSSSTFISADESEVIAAGDLLGISEKLILNE